ncbi:hypothetical protein SAY86_015270 [Trapa natans]|uniref:Uncharacterized protein n=1 Tax=Trapa natans TaxID=22666 RepID=A0AAN7KJ21_TRANT|nr:hypothetical protein SAY86_015270 [Trapa natans]
MGEMDMSKMNCLQSDDQEEEMGVEELRRGPWTVEEDLTLINYITLHGEGRWNSLARSAGLKRTGKSCRLRWLNYLRPDVRRGNITLEEQLLILELHSRWGNRWSKIAQYLPGRTDNEIKNYWRTRVQKHAKQLKCDVNSKQFKDTMRHLWMPRLVERIQAASAPAPAPAPSLAITSPGGSTVTTMTGGGSHNIRSTGASSSDSFGHHHVRSMATKPEDYYCHAPVNGNPDPEYLYPTQLNGYQLDESMADPCDGLYNNYGLMDFQPMEETANYQYLDGRDTPDNFWNVEDIWFTNYNI